MFYKKNFWNKKILIWEKNKYTSKKYLDVNSSVKNRQLLASYLLSQISNGKKVLELGCGSGKLWDSMCFTSFDKYIGVDFSDTAISTFQKKIDSVNNQKSVVFCQDCVSILKPIDIVFSLGLLDWLSLDQIEKIAKNYKDKWFFHSFSEKRKSFSQILHKLYVFSNYGYKTSYTPQYYKAETLQSLFSSKTKIYRNPKLKFSTFIYNLPDHVQFKI